MSGTRALFLALTALLGGPDFKAPIETRQPVEPSPARHRSLQEKRAARQARRLARMSCNPKATNRHREPCGDCYYCRSVRLG
jgi:hypothetical protein